MQKLREASLGINVFYIYLKFGICRSYFKRDIHVQKIKVDNKSYKFAFSVI